MKNYLGLLGIAVVWFGTLSTADAQRRIIGGVDTAPGDWSWMVSVQNSAGHFCGGSLIDAYWVLTAAHCLDNFYPMPTHLRVAVGLHRRSALLQSELIAVERFFQHPQWNTYNYDSPNDIALLQLSQPALPSSLKIATANSPVEQAGQTALALGWGVTRVSSNQHADILQQVELPLVALDLCQQVYKGEYRLIDSQLCAGFVEGGKDTCFGDSGGPLVAFDGTEWRQVGITSFGGKRSGLPCADAKAYGVYSRVSSFQDFIDSHLLSELVFTSPSQFRSGERWQTRLTEKNAALHPRPAVDLWLAIEVAETLWFVSGGHPAQPQLSLDAQPWATHIDAAHTDHLVLDISMDASFSGTYTLYAIFTEAEQGFHVDAIRSLLATQPISLNPTFSD